MKTPTPEEIVRALGLTVSEALVGVTAGAFIAGMEAMDRALRRGFEAAAAGATLEEVLAARGKPEFPDVAALLMELPALEVSANA